MEIANHQLALAPTAHLLRACQHRAWLKACSHPVAKALWFIESLYLSDITLDDIVSIAGVPRHQLIRAFALATGYSPMRYVRGRRLSEAARLLANGPPDVLAVALEYGYPSHESFVRAFRDEFGVSPETVRLQRHLDGIELVEPARLDESRVVDLGTPSFVEGREFLIAGIGRRHSVRAAPTGTPAQWRRFEALVHRIPGRVGDVTFGARCNADEHGHVDYVRGIEVANLSRLLPELYRLPVAARRYAVFRYRGDPRDALGEIWNRWLPQSGFDAADAPDFDRGDEIWVPLEAA